MTVLGRTPAPALEARGVRFVRGSLDDADAVRVACAGVETVFHVAAKVGVWGKYEEFFRTNVLGTRAVLAGCRAAGVRQLVYTSTPSVVYNGRALAGADESLPLTIDCPSPYPLTKAIAEREGSIHISNLMLESNFNASTRRNGGAKTEAAPAAEAPAEKKKAAKKPAKKAKAEKAE